MEPAATPGPSPALLVPVTERPAAAVGTGFSDRCTKGPLRAGPEAVQGVLEPPRRSRIAARGAFLNYPARRGGQPLTRCTNGHGVDRRPRDNPGVSPSTRYPAQGSRRRWDAQVPGGLTRTPVTRAPQRHHNLARSLIPPCRRVSQRLRGSVSRSGRRGPGRVGSGRPRCPAQAIRVTWAPPRGAVQGAGPAPDFP